MTVKVASRLSGLAIGVVSGCLATAAYAVAPTTEATVTAVGLDAYEGEIIEFGYADPRQAGGFEVLDLALIENGEATLRADLDTPLDAEFVVVTDEGPRTPGIVEPGGSHELNAEGAAMTFSGGNYQTLIGNAVEDAARGTLRDIYRNHNDPLARVLALRRAWKDRSGAWRDTEDSEQMAVLAELDQALGGNLSIDLINALIDSRDEASAKAIRDFTALNLAGEEVRLRDVLRENKYTLVEFWASWCGPCIAEIPHLQEAYDRFRRSGFEILAVNLDDDPENWRVASEEDYDINWLNVSDNQAFGSPVARLYRVKAIPANFLVSTEGKTVARRLRGPNVSETLEGLLGE